MSAIDSMPTWSSEKFKHRTVDPWTLPCQNYLCVLEQVTWYLWFSVSANEKGKFSTTQSCRYPCNSRLEPLQSFFSPELSNVPSKFEELQHLCLSKTRNPKRRINFNLKNFARLYVPYWNRNIMSRTIFCRIHWAGTNLVEKQRFVQGQVSRLLGHKLRDSYYDYWILEMRENLTDRRATQVGP